MSNKRIDLKHYENKYTFETPPDPNWNGAPWTTADLKVLLDELNRCYRIIDILQDSEDFDTQVAFHEEGLCKYLKYPCGPCETLEE